MALDPLTTIVPAVLIGLFLIGVFIGYFLGKSAVQDKVDELKNMLEEMDERR